MGFLKNNLICLIEVSYSSSIKKNPDFLKK